MPIEFDCPQCARHYRVAETFAGKRIRCKQCQAVLDVPQAAGASMAEAPAEQPMRPASRVQPGMPRQQPASVAAPFGTVTEDRSGPRKVNFVFLAGAVLLLFGFMTPWISIEGVIRISGFQIPVMFNKFATAMGDKSGQFLVLYFMYFIPLACVIAMVDEFLSAKRGRNRWYLRLVAALSPAIAFMLIVLTFPSPKQPENQPQREEREQRSAPSGGPSVFDFLGFGLYISMAGFVVSFAGVFTSPKRGPAPVAFMPRPRKAPLPVAPRMPGPMRRPPRE
jgi:hypothetical protein